MDNVQKLQRIFLNVIDKCDGNIFYRIIVDGALASIYKNGHDKITAELETNGSTLDMSDIESVDFNCVYAFCTFIIDGEEHCLDVVRDMSFLEIMETLAQ